MTVVRGIWDIFFGRENRSSRIVPPTGFTARLTVFSSAAMAFLAVFALAFSLASARLATVWSSQLAQTSTVRISAPAAQLDAQTAVALEILNTTPGVQLARVMSQQDQRKLLEPWFGPDLPLDKLPIPTLIEIEETRSGYDTEGLRLRLAADAPGAVLDDHTRWRQPVVAAAKRLRFVGWVSVLLIIMTTASIITLAAQSALAANAKEIAVLRLIGAIDSYIAQAFVRRFARRAALGALVGTVVGSVTIAAFPTAEVEAGFLTGFGFRGADWFWPLLIPPLVAFVAFWATRSAAKKMLKGLT
jgi:cell division transport system permease protein